MMKLKSIGLLLLALLVATPAMAQTQSAPSATLISVSSSKDLDTFLVGKDGMTLYDFTVDPLNKSMCNDKCSTAWPPLTVKATADITVADGIPGKFATITRADGTLQVTYNEIPLYYWFKDKKAGDTTGHRVTRNWWVVPPATVYGQEIPTLGNVLVGPTGMTLYTFGKDTADTSACNDKFATAWPPLTVKTADEVV